MSREKRSYGFLATISLARSNTPPKPHSGRNRPNWGTGLGPQTSHCAADVKLIEQGLKLRARQPGSRLPGRTFGLFPDRCVVRFVSDRESADIGHPIALTRQLIEQLLNRLLRYRQSRLPEWALSLFKDGREAMFVLQWVTADAREPIILFR